MSDTSQAAAAVQQQSAPAAPAADVVAAVQQQSDPTQGDTVPRDWFEKEKQNNIRMRNLYKRGDDLLRELDEPSQEAIVAIAEMARNRDVDGIIDWALGTVENLTGGDVAAAIARRQGGQAPQPFQQQPAAGPGFNQPPSTAPVDLDMVKQLAAEEARSIMRQEQFRAQVDNELRSAGYPPEHPAGQAIIRYAAVNNAPISAAIQWFETDLSRHFAARQQALATAAGQVPAPSPTGAPAAGEGVNMTPRERAMRRLTGGGAPT